MKFTLQHETGPFGDETSLYSVDFPKGATVSDLIDFALSNTREWGRINIKPDILKILSTYRLEYRYGVTISDTIPPSIKYSPIKKVSAHGGWTMMDYNIEI